jgi:hypothetical protein
MRFGGGAENECQDIQPAAYGRSPQQSGVPKSQAMRFVFSITGAALQGRGVGALSAVSRRTGITGLVGRAGKSGASISLFTGRSGNEMPPDSAESLRRTRRGGRCIALWLRLCARTHSARRAWMSTSMSSSSSSIMFLRRFARSFSRASSKDSSETFEQVARYSSIGLVVFIWIVSKFLSRNSPMQGPGEVKHTVHSEKVNIENELAEVASELRALFASDRHAQKGRSDAIMKRMFPLVKWACVEGSSRDGAAQSGRQRRVLSVMERVILLDIGVNEFARQAPQ